MGTSHIRSLQGCINWWFFIGLLWPAPTLPLSALRVLMWRYSTEGACTCACGVKHLVNIFTCPDVAEAFRLLAPPGFVVVMTLAHNAKHNQQASGWDVKVWGRVLRVVIYCNAGDVKKKRSFVSEHNRTVQVWAHPETHCIISAPTD